MTLRLDATELALRISVTLTALVSLAGLGAAGLLHPLPGLVAGLTCLVAALLAPASGLRQRALPASLAAATMLVGLTAASAWLLDQTGVRLLGAAAAAAIAAVAIEAPTTRNTQLRVWTAGAALALTAAGGGSAGVVACLLLGGVGLLVTLALCQRVAVDVGGAPPPTHERTRRSARSRTSWLAGPVVAVIVLALVAAWALAKIPTPPGGGGGSSSQVPGGFGDLGQGRESGGRGGTGTAAEREVTPYLGGDLDLSARGDLGDAPLFEVPGDAGPRLWRIAVLDRYEQGHWMSSVAASPLMALPRGGGAVPSFGADPRLGAPASAVVGVLADDLPEPLPVMAPGPITYVTSAGPGYVDTRMTVNLFEVDRGYTVDWRDRARADDVLSGSVGGDTVGLNPGPQPPVVVSPRLQDLSDRLLAPLRAGDGEDLPDRDPARDPAAAALLIEDYLRENATYSLDAPVPPAGVDPVDAFLFDDHVGFCEQFATAEVLLLRAGGFPARLATGFSAPASSLRADGTRPRVTVTSAMAHAWVEVFVPGSGWVSSDPTAGTTLADPDRTARARDWLRAHAVVIAVVFGAIVVLGLLGWGAWMVVRRRRRRLAGAGPGGVPDRMLDEQGRGLVDAYLRLDRELAARGVARRPAETLADLARRLVPPGGVASVLPGASRPAPGAASAAAFELPAVDGALHVLEQVLYGGSPPAEDVQAATEQLDAAARSLTGSGARVLSGAGAAAR